MGLCGGAQTGGVGNMVSEGINKYVMNLVVQRATGSTGDSQMGFLTGLIKDKIPGANITEQIVPNASPNLFNISTGGNLIHSTEQNGSVQNNADGILSKLTSIATQQGGNILK